MAKGGMREAMPLTAALIDDLRDAFGKDYIDRILAAGMKGEPVFWARENGHTVGTPVLVGHRVLADENGNRCMLVAPDGTKEKYVCDAGRRVNMRRGR